MDTEITVVLIKCLDGCNIRSCFDHLNHRHNSLQFRIRYDIRAYTIKEILCVQFGLVSLPLFDGTVGTVVCSAVIFLFLFLFYLHFLYGCIINIILTWNSD